ncbi:hypothetical protein GCM10010912_17850 [Paenibacillus albidus]|uniref:Uncharacterized protein n=1 Tax=Paenibacillus albidus TaxID=2041023 RepID=A0A917C7T0_9BACL|nr:hypothetical protein [Paenibacillus albidus]GGF73078.1 hypothetical protein GCM10010912_17850 [Paenibacillus albidus]
MNQAIYTKDGKLRKNPPARYVRRLDKQPVQNSRIKQLKYPGITFVVGPNGEQLDDNPDHTEWMRLRHEQDQKIVANRI